MIQEKLPIFLTQEIVNQAISSVIPILTKESLLGSHFKRHQFHIVVLVPKQVTNQDGHVHISPHILHEQTFGDKSSWERPYDEIARSKAFTLWQERHDGRTDAIPHLLYTGDTPFYGGVKRDEIVVTCSGLQPWFDKMLSGMLADICIALAYDAWQLSEQNKNKKAFV